MLLGFPSCRALLAAAHLRTARRRPLTLSSTLSSPFRSTESRICGTPPLGVFFGRPTGSHEKLPEFQWLKLCNVFVVELSSTIIQEWKARTCKGLQVITQTAESGKAVLNVHTT
ncbi:unnamed protein product [Urochloa humidicola]